MCGFPLQRHFFGRQTPVASPFTGQEHLFPNSDPVGIIY
jgi:hypothetical protein